MGDWSREDVSTLKGVGPKLKEKLARLGINNKQQMLFHLPLRYEDRTQITAVGSVQSGQRVLIQAEVLQSGVSFRRQGRSRRILLAKLSDGTGLITLRFFNFNASQQNSLEKGSWVRCFGEARMVMGSIEMVHPEYEIINPDEPPPLNSSLTPVYPVTDGLHQLSLRKIMQQLITQLSQQGLTETLPEKWIQQHQLPSVTQALQILHNPRNLDDVKKIQSVTHPAQNRFIIEELTAQL